MTLKPDLFDFAFVPDWYGQLDELAQIALPEPWRFKKPTNVTMPEKQHSFSMWRTRGPVSIPGFTTAGIKGFTLSLTGTTERIPCWNGISGDSVTNCHRG